MAGSNVRKLPSGKWQARLMVDGNRVSKTFGTKNLAKDWIKTQEAAALVGEFTGSTPKVTFGEFAETWLKGHTGRAKTIEAIQGDLKNHLLPTFATVLLSDISPTSVRDWHAAHLAKGTPSATSRAYRNLKAILNAAVDDQLIKSNPCTIKTAAKTPPKEIHPLSLDELWKVHDAMDPRFQAWVLLSGYGGLRISESFGLLVSDFDPKKGTVKVTKQVQSVNGGPLELVAPKTKAGTRTVGLPSFVSEALEAHVKTLKLKKDDPLFPASKGGFVRINLWRDRYWKPAVSELSWSPVPHDLRHTAASLAISVGVDIKTLQTMLGHESAALTLDTYGHLMGNSVETVQAKMETLPRPT